MNMQVLDRNEKIIGNQILEYKKYKFKEDDKKRKEHKEGKQEIASDKKHWFTIDLTGQPFIPSVKERLQPLQKESLESVINNISAKKATVDNLTQLILKIKESRNIIDNINLRLSSGDISSYPQLKSDIYFFSDELKEKIEQLIIILNNENLLIK
jgi:hypothetical protein